MEALDKTMICTAPPEPADAELLAYLEGAGSPAVSSHLSNCEYCLSRAMTLARDQQRLMAQLYRSTCPPVETLIAYELDTLPGDLMPQVIAHLGVCPHCTREMAQLKGFLADTARDLERDPLASVKLAIGTLMGSDLLTLHLSGVRGAGSAQQVYQAGDLMLALEFDSDPADRSRRSLLGLVGKNEWIGSQVSLRSAEKLAGQTVIGESGQFVLQGVDPGSYTLILEKQPDEAHFSINVE